LICHSVQGMSAESPQIRPCNRSVYYAARRQGLRR
jgi:hypothetical protein